MHFVAMENVIGAVPAPMNRDELTSRVQRIGQASRQHGQRFNIKVITYFAEHDQVEVAPCGVGREISPQIAALNADIVQACATHPRPIHGGL